MSEKINKIKAIIVDDEEDAIDAIRFSLQNYCPEVEIVATSSTIKDAFKKINAFKVELVFLDINLKDILSFELLKLFNPIPFHIIFITGFDQFAIQAIKYAALDYLLKPVHKDELKLAVEKAMTAKAAKVSLQLLEEQLMKKSLSNKIAINIGAKTVLVEMNDIMYCFAEDNYTRIVLVTGEKYLSSNYLIYFEDLLSKEYFFRIHRSFLINLNHVESYSTNYSNVLMINKEELTISSRKKSLFSKHIKTIIK